MDLRFDKKLPLQSEGEPFYYTKNRLEPLKEELEEFISGPGSYMNERKVAERFLGWQEIQSNNSVEGYNDDARVILSALSASHADLVSSERLKIIRNLHAGYERILEGKDITKDNLKSLYDILSNGLLENDDVQSMGDYYRNGDVFIQWSRNLAKPLDKGLDKMLIEEYMNSLFDYINDDNDLSMVDYYVKSQIIHFYIVYIHPYFDVNGRTSRTTAMWYLINNEAFPFIIFNRAIPFDYTKYIMAIRDTKKFHNLTFFLNYMLSHVKVELEKEFVINSINNTLSCKLSEEEYQTLRYILSIKGLKTVKDFTSFYNRFHDKKHFVELKRSMIEPLLDKDVLNFVRYTNGEFGENANFVFEINSDRIDNDPSKIKRLKI